MRRPQRVTISRLAAIAVAIAAVASANVAITAAAQTAGKPMTTASGLQIIDTKVGTGASPKPGQTCVMHYTGWLYDNGQKGKKFDSSVDRNEPFEFPIGQHRVIAGWDEGVATMKVGGKRTLIIPPALGYGARGAGAVAETEPDRPAQRLSAYRYRDLHAARHRRLVEPACGYAVLRNCRVHLGSDPWRDARDSAADGGTEGRQMADRRRPHLARQDARHLWLWPDRRGRSRLWQGVRHEGPGVGARACDGEGA